VLLDILSGDFSVWTLVSLLVSVPIVLFSLSFHEFAHAWAADKLGDSTARWHGRLTLNPFRHLDLVGTLSMIAFGIGWAKPVPVDVRNFRNPKKGMALTGLAGPVSNLILSFAGILCYRILNAVTALNVILRHGNVYTYQNAQIGIFDVIAIFFIVFSQMNAYLAVFNLIPVPPFDGSRIFYFLLPDKWYFSVMRYERVIMIVMLVLLATGILTPVISAVSDGVLSAFDFVIRLVPFL
jgi:Zn-dependent protease